MSDARNALEPPFRKRELPEPVARQRAVAERRQSLDASRLQPYIDGHLLTYSTALDQLERDHQGLADQTDFAMTGDTRYAASWQLAGRCIGLARAVIYLLRGGFCAEAVALQRTLHECARLLEAVSDSAEDELTCKWLDDVGSDYVSAKEARMAEERADQRRAEQMREAGDKPIGGTAHLSRDMYDKLSWSGHNRRRATQEFVVEALRTMSRGPHPDAVVRGAYVRWGGDVIEEAVLSIGEAMIRWHGPSYFLRRIQPLQESFRAIRQEMPLETSW
jgi:hypothetical protein